MNNYIEIIDDQGNESTYEIVTTFKIDGYSSNYVVYKDGSDTYFYGKYDGSSMSFLDTNLSQEEIALCQEEFAKEKDAMA